MSEFVNAARHGDLARMRHLLASGQSHVNETEARTNLTALHTATANMNEATTYVLLAEYKADPHLKDAQGRKPLDIAIETGQEKTKQMLYEATHAQNTLSVSQPFYDGRSSILPFQAIEHHAQAQNSKGQGR